MDITRPPEHGYLSECVFELRRTCPNYKWKKVSPAYCHFNLGNTQTNEYFFSVRTTKVWVPFIPFIPFNPFYHICFPLFPMIKIFFLALLFCRSYHPPPQTPLCGSTPILILVSLSTLISFSANPRNYDVGFPEGVWFAGRWKQCSQPSRGGIQKVRMVWFGLVCWYIRTVFPT